MQKYHISKDGSAKPCKAEISCPLGAETPHSEFKNSADAKTWAEREMAKKHGGSFSNTTSTKSDTDTADSSESYKNLSNDEFNNLYAKFHNDGAQSGPEYSRFASDEIAKINAEKRKRAKKELNLPDFPEHSELKNISDTELKAAVKFASREWDKNRVEVKEKQEKMAQRQRNKHYGSPEALKDSERSLEWFNRMSSAISEKNRREKVSTAEKALTNAKNRLKLEPIPTTRTKNLVIKSIATLKKEQPDSEALKDISSFKFL